MCQVQRNNVKQKRQSGPLGYYGLEAEIDVNQKLVFHDIQYTSISLQLWINAEKEKHGGPESLE